VKLSEVEGMRKNNPNPPILCPHGVTPKRNCKECRREYGKGYNREYRRRKRKSEKPKLKRRRRRKFEAKICANCGIEYKSQNEKYCSRDCSNSHISKLRLQKKVERQKEGLLKKEDASEAPIGQCPLLEKCRGASGIDCSKRNHLECPFYRTLLSEKEGRIRMVMEANKRRVQVKEGKVEIVEA